MHCSRNTIAAVIPGQTWVNPEPMSADGRRARPVSSILHQSSGGCSAGLRIDRGCGYDPRVKPTLAAILVVFALVGCSSSNSPLPDPTPRVTPAPSGTAEAPPVLENVCSHVSRGLVAEMLGADVVGTDELRAAPGQWGNSRSCLFSRDGAQLSIGLGPVPRPVADAGMALAAELGLSHAPEGASRTYGVGELAVYDPLRIETSDGESTDRMLQLVAVQHRSSWYDAVFIIGYDPTLDRHVLGHIAQEQLVFLAQRCLASLS